MLLPKSTDQQEEGGVESRRRLILLKSHTIRIKTQTAKGVQSQTNRI